MQGTALEATQANRRWAGEPSSAEQVSLVPMSRILEGLRDAFGWWLSQITRTLSTRRLDDDPKSCFLNDQGGLMRSAPHGALLLAFVLAANSPSPVGAQVSGGELRSAVFVGDEALVRKLVASKETANSANGDGLTATMVAAALGRTAILKRLAAAGVSVNAKDKTGATAVMFASYFGQLDAVKLLVVNGATIAAKTSLGGQFTAMDFAQLPPRGESNKELHDRRLAVAEFLTSKGASTRKLTPEDLLFAWTTNDLAATLEKAKAERR